jgi:hypothetical protein
MPMKRVLPKIQSYHDDLTGAGRKKSPAAIFHSGFETAFSGTSTHSRLCKLRVEIIVIKPADLPAIDKQKKNKTDLHDSRANIDQFIENF